MIFKSDMEVWLWHTFKVFHIPTKKKKKIIAGVWGKRAKNKNLKFLLVHTTLQGLIDVRWKYGCDM